MEEICRFSGTSSYCQILTGVKCRGTDALCKFRKTENQFREDRNKAIITNRKKSNCSHCRYMTAPCQINSEKGSV